MGDPGELTAELLEEWALWMRAAGMSERTVHNRVSLIGFFGRFAGVDACLADWKALAAFLGREVAPGQRIAPGTRSVNYADLDAWFSWLLAMDYRTDNPVDRLHKPKAVKRYPRPVLTEQLERVLARCNRRRTEAMLYLGAYQGLRVHEIAKFRGEHIEGQFLYVVGKGSKPARLPLHPDVAAIALDFPRYGYWFPSYTLPGQPIAAKSVCTVISKLMKRAEVSATAHQLRHWYGTEVLRAAGGNMRIAQELLRHDSPATTALYTFVDDAEARAAIMGLPRVGGRQAPIASVVDVVSRLRIVA
jgi:integrase